MLGVTILLFFSRSYVCRFAAEAAHAVVLVPSYHCGSILSGEVVFH